MESRCKIPKKTRFRGVAARINFLAMDRSDLQFAAKELCRKMARPEPKDWDKARTTARYLKFRPRGVLEFPFEQRNEKLDGRREGLHEINIWWCAEVEREYRSAEAELYAMSKCAQQTAIARDLGVELSAVVHSGATAALGIAHRRGLGGRTRHVKVQFLWIQDAVEKRLGKSGLLENPADMLTKFLANDALSKHAQRLSLSFKPGRSSADKAADALARLSGP